MTQNDRCTNPNCTNGNCVGCIGFSLKTQKTVEELRKKYVEMWDKGEFEFNHHFQDELRIKPINPVRIWNIFIEPLLAERAKMEECMREVEKEMRVAPQEEPKTIDEAIKGGLLHGFNQGLLTALAVIKKYV